MFLCSFSTAMPFSIAHCTFQPVEPEYSGISCLFFVREIHRRKLQQKMKNLTTHMLSVIRPVRAIRFFSREWKWNLQCTFEIIIIFVNCNIAFFLCLLMLQYICECDVDLKFIWKYKYLIYEMMRCFSYNNIQ